MQKSGRVAIMEIANALKGFSPQQYAAVNSAIAKIRGGKALASDEAAILNDLGARADKLILARATDCPSGACTMPDGTCTQTKQLDCKGTYKGDGTTCPTGPVQGRQHLHHTDAGGLQGDLGGDLQGRQHVLPHRRLLLQSTQTCDTGLTQDACIAKNGSYMGNYTDCGKGACYLQDNCSITYGRPVHAALDISRDGCGLRRRHVGFSRLSRRQERPFRTVKGTLGQCPNPFAALTFSSEDYLMANSCTGPMLSCGFSVMMTRPSLSKRPSPCRTERSPSISRPPGAWISPDVVDGEVFKETVPVRRSRQLLVRLVQITGGPQSLRTPATVPRATPAWSRSRRPWERPRLP